MKKVAVLIGGHLRDFQFENLQKRVLEPLLKNGYKTNIFISTWNVKGNREQNWNNGYVENSFCFEDANIKNVEFEQFDRDYFIQKYFTPSWHPQYSCAQTAGDGACMWYKIYKSWKLMENFETLHGIQHDIVIRTRPDLVIHEDFDIVSYIENIEDKVYMPEWHEKYEEVTLKLMDQFAFGKRNIMQFYCSTFEYIPLSSTQWRTAEGYLHEYLKKNNISLRRFYLNYGLMRVNNYIHPVSGPPKPKVAVLLCGHTRTWEQCKQSFWSTFKNCDVFAHTYDLQYGYHPAVQQQFGSDDQVVQIFDQTGFKKCVIESQENNDQLIIEKQKQFHPLMHDFIHGYLQYLKSQKCFELMKEYEEEHGFHYERCVKTRFDLEYYNFENMLNSSFCIIDSKNVFPNDYILICSRDIMSKISDFILHQYENPTNELSWTRPPHGVLQYFFMITKTYPQLNDICRIIRKNVLN